MLLLQANPVDTLLVNSALFVDILDIAYFAPSR